MKKGNAKKYEQKELKNQETVENNNILVTEEPIEEMAIEQVIEPIEQETVVEESTVSKKNVSEVGQKDCAEASSEELSYDYVTVKVDGNNCSVNSKGFTKEQEKAIAMTMFQMRNRFGLESNFTVNVRK